MATHSSLVVWRTPWTEEPGRLQSTGSQRVRHDCARKHACSIFLSLGLFLPVLSLTQSEFNRKSNRLESQDAFISGLPPHHLCSLGQVTTPQLFFFSLK